MKIKTSNLTGNALRWAVGIAEQPDGAKLVWRLLTTQRWKPDTDWSQGGPIIEREKLCLIIGHAGVWLAYSLQNYTDEPTFMVNGPTPLVAAMRAFVSSKLGDEIEIPEELQ